MTFLEKAMEIDKSGGREQHPNALIRRNCPFDYGLEESDVCNRVGQEKCFECWNREMPNIELKAEILKEVHEHFGTEESDISYVEGLEHGRHEVWEFMKKWVDITHVESMDIFGTSSLKVLADRYAPQEALAKLKAYEEAQIEVGDVVKTNALGYGIVTKEDEEHYSILCANGNAVWCEKSRVTKTGKHIGIKSILESIGE